MSRTRFILLVVVLLAGVGVTFGMVENPFRAAGKRPLTLSFREFPVEISDASGTVWTGQDRELPAKAIRIAAMDNYLRRDYRSSDGRTAQIFVSYYGNVRAGLDTIYHNPTVCFPSHGWEPKEERAEAAGEGPDRIPLTAYRFVKGPKEYVVLNFFVVNDRRLARSPREDPLELAKQKFSLSSEPGYYVQVQVIAESRRDREDGLATSLEFLAAAGPHLFPHF